MKNDNIQQDLIKSINAVCLALNQDDKTFYGNFFANVKNNLRAEGESDEEVRSKYILSKEGKNKND